MTYVFEDLSRTFSEFLLVPNLSDEECIPENVSLLTDLARYRKGQEPSRFQLNIPFTSAIMQAVSDDHMAIALARSGGLSFIYGSQPIDRQAEMIRKVKRYKAGFVSSDSNLTPENDLADILALKQKSGHSTVAITDDGSSHGKLLGLVTSRDYRISRLSSDTKIKEFMTPLDQLICGQDGLTLSEANDIIWDNKLNQLPIVDAEGHLVSLVFRKDYDAHKENPDELLDAQKSLMCGAGINTRDYPDRVPALVDAGADVLCIDSSDGFSIWQKKTIDWIRARYGKDVIVGAGNVVDAEGFRYLAEAGADFIKVGIGGGSICITREQKGIGCGQASAVMAVAKARDEWFAKTGEYVPICSDGGIVYDYHMTLALAMGADFLMLGRYFSRFDEAPGQRLVYKGNYVKEYWGEGSNRARNWARYADTGSTTMHFEEGVDSYVPYAGPLKENLETSMAKIIATMVSCGSKSIEELQKKARLVVVSPTSIVEGGAHDVIRKENERHS
ncbi:MAG: IMP dehydrogenase [Eubacteriales bacterium]|nr:IMP dehydrogenase [Clostridiales bacterium]MDY5836313.1 IMP dehydrogenase [Eubacteriales bacterium]